MKSYIILLLFVCFSIVSYGNKLKFGKVNISDLTMKYYEEDSSANAVILYDRGEFNSINFSFFRHVRIKILKKAGTQWANWELKTPTRGSFDAFVFNYDNNEVKKSKLPLSSVHKQELIRGHTIYKIFLPDVKVGSVIDLKYTFNGMPLEWRFQELIPVKYSELKIEMSPYVQYHHLVFGNIPINTISKNHWVAENVPAFNSEPYMSHYSNYISKIQFEVTSFSIPSEYTWGSTGIYRNFASDWQQISKYLLQDRNFGSVINGCNFLKKKAEQIENRNLPVDEKVRLCVEYIQENIQWNNIDRLYASEFYDINFEKKHSGTSADINLILISLLKKAGISAWPVVLSTRQNGRLSSFFPSNNNLNYVIAHVKFGDKGILIDATDPKLEIGYLPEKCLNGNGWVVDEYQGEWLNLLKTNKINISKMISINASDNGIWKAEVTQSFGGYGYLNWKNEFENRSNLNEYENYLGIKYEELKIEELEIIKDSSEEVKCTEKIEFDISEKVDIIDNEIYLTPVLFSSFDDNPFKSELREFPVDLIYPVKEFSMYTISIPENVEVISVPEPISIRLPGGGGGFTFLTLQNGNVLQIQLKFELSKEMYTEEEYHFLRNFYSLAIEKVNEPIHLITVK